MSPTVNKGNWEEYLGWSQFELNEVLPEYMASIDVKRGMKIVSVGCGQGFPENQLLEQGVDLLGIDANEELLKQARDKGLQVQLLDAYKIKDVPELKEIADVVVVPFLVHNTPNEKMLELFNSFRYLLKPGGKLVVLDPNSENEHRLSTDKGTFRKVLDIGGRKYLNSSKLNPDCDKYLVEIHLNAGLLNETVIVHQHKSHAEYESAIKSNEFKNVTCKPIGFQVDVQNNRFPAYQIWTASK